MLSPFSIGEIAHNPLARAPRRVCQARIAFALRLTMFPSRPSGTHYEHPDGAMQPELLWRCVTSVVSEPDSRTDRSIAGVPVCGTPADRVRLFAWMQSPF